MCQGQRYLSHACSTVGALSILWEMDDGQVHRIPQGEGGEQGDPMMPLYSPGQHGALEAAPSHTRGERLLHVHRHPQCSSGDLRMDLFQTH